MVLERLKRYFEFLVILAKKLCLIKKMFVTSFFTSDYTERFDGRPKIGVFGPKGLKIGDSIKVTFWSLRDWRTENAILFILKISMHKGKKCQSSVKSMTPKDS